MSLSDPEKFWRHQDELSIVLVGRRKIAELNRRFLNHEGPTDVITFDYTKEIIHGPDNEPRLIGEIFVCIDVAAEAAKKYNQSVSKEVILYIVHGMLHLCGFDDHQEEQIKLMRQAEECQISKLNQTFNLDDFTFIEG